MESSRYYSYNNNRIATGSIILYGGTVPNSDPLLAGWEVCSGQQLRRTQNPRLFGVIGNKFGGNQDLFALPDFRGRMALGAGNIYSYSSSPSSSLEIIFLFFFFFFLWFMKYLFVIFLSI